MFARFALLFSLSGIVAGCAAGGDAAYYAGYCTDLGYAEASQAFNDCVAAKRHEIATERKRRVRPPDPADL